MSPSSLIFLLIVAIWAAYLLQHWVRRREHLATARTVDRFSEAMRVLERREPWVAAPVDAPEHRSYAVSPVRATRPGPVVEDADPEPTAPSPAEPKPGARSRSSSRGRDAERPARRGVRRVRGISLVVAVLALLALAVLVPVLSLPWWSLGIAGGVLVADLVWLRSAARRSTGRRSTGLSSAARRPAAPKSPAREEPRAARERRPMPEPVLHDELATEDRQPVEATAQEEPKVNAAPPAADPHGWQPVPVPPPTYTLKAKAERPVPAPTQSTDTVAVEEEVFDASLSDGGAGTDTAGTDPADTDYSRVPTSDLPFDGYALDEDLEDLPAVYQAV